MPSAEQPAQDQLQDFAEKAGSHKLQLWKLVEFVKVHKGSVMAQE